MKCEDCVYYDDFKPRKDEIKKYSESVRGCRKPGWEGYTFNDNPYCGGQFFVERRKEAHHDHEKQDDTDAYQVGVGEASRTGKGSVE